MESLVETSAERTESPYAVEGTRAHDLAELEVASTFGLWSTIEVDMARQVWKEKTPFEQQADMIRYVDLYVAFIESLVENKSDIIQVERRVDTGVPQSWGTADTIIVRPRHVHVVDFKYGQGVPVEAEGNSQLRLYGLGALDLYDLLGEVKSVSVSVFQPRLGMQSTETLSATELRQWRDTVVIPAAKEALSDNAHFGPSESACRFCPAAGECKPRLDHVLSQDFGDPNLLTPEEIGEALEKLPDIKSWCGDLEKTALEKAYAQGVPIPGWKVVRSGGRRVIRDTAAAVQTLIDYGYTAEQVARPGIKPLGELEKLIGRKELPDVLGDLLEKTDGREALVSEEDRRPAISPTTEAQKDF